MTFPLILSAFVSAAVPDAGTAAFDAKKPETWGLLAKLAPKSRAREELIRQWLVPAKVPGEAALTRAEAEALLDDPRAQMIYWEKTISIVAPSMLVRQRKAHVDLLKVFLASDRVEAAAEFFATHRQQLEKSAAKHKVDPSVVVSILMWESKLGKVTGDFLAFNAFISQAFFADDANALALLQKGEKAMANTQAERVATIKARALNNLSVLVRQCASRKIDPLTIKGSWAGALGYPQFMPASLRWAEDGDSDGKIDLYTFDDSIASIANYLAEFGFSSNREKAVWSYNHEAAYVTGVLAFADALTARMKDGGR